MAKNPYAVKLGRMGGRASAKSLTPEQRSDRARKGAVEMHKRREAKRDASPDSIVFDITQNGGKPNIQALRDICAGNLPAPPIVVGITTPNGNHYDFPDAAEVPICGKTWWEDGEQYECLMDAVHKNLKHGQGGMVRRLDA